MPRLDDTLRNLSIPINTQRGSTPPSSSGEASETDPLPLPPNTCPLCRGAGYTTLAVPITDPNFGRLIHCVCKLQEIEERNFTELTRWSNLDAFSDKVFERFDAQVPGVDEALAVARQYAQTPDGWLLLMGNCGCGKTHLAASIALEVTRQHNLKALFTIVPDLLDHLRSTYHPTSPISYDERFEQVRSVALLVLDDLGTESPTPWAQEKLFQIINHRYNEKLSTVFTSNVDLDYMDYRIRSRLLDRRLCRHVYIEAADYRQRDVPQRRPNGARPSGGRRRTGHGT